MPSIKKQLSFNQNNLVTPTKPLDKQNGNTNVSSNGNLEDLLPSDVNVEFLPVPEDLTNVTLLSTPIPPNILNTQPSPNPIETPPPK